MAKTLVIYEDSKEISKAVLDGTLRFNLTLKLQQNDSWDVKTYISDTEISFSAFSLAETLNIIMKEKNIPIKFYIQYPSRSY